MIRHALAIFIALTIILNVPHFIAYGQNNTDAPNSNTMSKQTNTANGAEFDWRWLIPLLAIPILFYIFKDRSLTDYPDEQKLSGIKGGQTERRNTETQSVFGEDDHEEE